MHTASSENAAASTPDNLFLKQQCISFVLSILLLFDAIQLIQSEEAQFTYCVNALYKPSLCP